MPAFLEGLATADPGTLPLSAASSLFQRLRATTPQLARRAPGEHDAARWREHRISERFYRVAQPVTFTPYAAARPCSARCLFCSENLRPLGGGAMAQTLRPGPDHFERLSAALAQLRGLPLSWSLSGLESSDDEDWFLRLLETLSAAERDGVRVEDRVLYSNGAGFARGRGEELIAALRGFGLSWVELSRHHFDTARNHRIMRFRDGEPIAEGAAFERVARALSASLPVRQVCILQRGGIDDADGVAAYLDWARTYGAGTVIFREFSRLDAGYRDNATRRYVDAERVPIEHVLAACMDAAWWPRLTPLRITEGYYFWNLRLRDERSGVDVVFESSDYAAMHRRHASGDIYKLVFHGNGRLCAGWQPDRDVLWPVENPAQERADG
ncbi:hypothetical protein J5226_22705 [Lysobacter sp. K5869]|uniref:hypothetical protein n=1 Tax=Lysobacter sp. K5869 TaxID=2820808 RepID=UPI001C0626F8|nr:hypothetical protein [Lysobacter sp. K5869]QWP76361.1 hypothetical protein J5226_22705 [Lysobacter sp. K5869]